MKLRWFFSLLVVMFVWGVVSRFIAFPKLVGALTSARWQWALVSTVLLVGYLAVYAGVFQSALRTVEVKSRLSQVLPLVFVWVYTGIAHLAGYAGREVPLDEQVPPGDPTDRRVENGRLLARLAFYGAFTLILLPGWLFLLRLRVLNPSGVILALLILVAFGAASWVLLLGLRQPSQLFRLFEGLRFALNRLMGVFHLAPRLPPEWSDQKSKAFIEVALVVMTNPMRFQRTIWIALAAHLMALAGLHGLFLAFHQPVNLGVLVAGYAIGLLVERLPLPPSGIGLVEGLMALGYFSLGVPAERAVIIALSYRLICFWIPAGIGAVLIRQPGAFRREARLRSEIWSVRIVASLTAAMGVINVLSAVTPTMAQRFTRLADFSPLGVRHGGRLTATLAGFALLMLASNLWRRKRVAWFLSVGVLIVSAFSHMVKGPDFEEAILATALAAWLIYLRPHFHARSDPPSVRQGLTTLAAALGFTLAYGITGFYFMDHQFRVNFGLVAAGRQTVIMFTQFYDPGLQPITGLGRFFADSIYIVGFVTIGYAFIMLVRPVLVRRSSHPDERARAQQIVQSCGHSSLARLTLMEDKSYFFSPGGSVIAYVLAGRTALALGDPIGPREDLLGTLAAFQQYCERNDWLPAYYQVLADNLGAYQRTGYSSVCIGQEAIVDLDSFTLSGRSNKGLRSGVNRIARLGYQIQVYEPPWPAELLHEMRMISDEWLTAQGSTEMRFSLGWFDKDYLESCPVAIVRNPAGSMDAFANILTEYQANEVAIDLMRHRSESEHGLMDFLFASLFEWAKAKGYASFNLGLSALSGIGEAPDDPAIERALHYIYEHVDQFYNFKGLHEFKDKFNPQWSPRYLIYPSLASLPLVTIALIQADTGDDLLASVFRRA